MKRIVLVFAAAAALLCGCDKYGPRIDEIEGRLSALEQKCEDLNGNIGTIGKLVDALNNGITIKDVKKVDNGFQIFFSDGTSYYIVNGEKGPAPAITAAMDGDTYYWKVNNEWLTDGEGNKIPVTGTTPQLKYDSDTGVWSVSTDGGQTWEELGVQKTGTDITFTEDDEAYYFDFGDGNVAKISKMASFVMKAETDKVSVEAGKSVTVAYTLTGGDETTHVVAEASGYTATVDEKALTVTITAGSSVEPGYVIMKAIRNSDGASSSQFIAVNDGSAPEEKETIELELTEVTYNTVSYKATPSDKEMPYIVSLASKAYIDEYGLDTDEALFADDVDYFTYLGQSYGMSVQDVFDVLADVGDTEYGFDDLDPETEYVLYAYGLDENYQLATDITRVAFTTPEAPAGGKGYEAVLGTWLFKGTKTSNGNTTAWEAEITFEEKVKNESFNAIGFYNTYPAVVLYNESDNIIEIPFGANNPIARFNFGGDLGVKWGCWMGFDGTYVYTRDSFYWKLNDSYTAMTSATEDDGELLDPIGITGGVYNVNDDGSVGSWAEYTFGPGLLLFTSITKVESNGAAASSKTAQPRRRFTDAEATLAVKAEKAVPANMLYVK